MKRMTGVALLATVLTACSPGSDETSASIPTTVYSPNGEPLSGGPLGRIACDKAIGDWLSRLAPGGGSLSEAAFAADAQRQFAVMDIDHNGYIVSEELDRYRAPYLQQTYVQTKDDEGFLKKNKSRRGTIQSNPALSLSDPVMSADTNLDFKVTPEEFLKQAHRVFADLDANHDGMLDRTEVQGWCKPKKP